MVVKLPWYIKQIDYQSWCGTQYVHLTWYRWYQLPGRFFRVFGEVIRHLAEDGGF